MKLKDLPPEALREMQELAYEMKQDNKNFDPVKDPMDRIAVMLHWCVREIVRMRKQ